MNFGKFCSGLALSIVGLIMFLKNITIGGISFYSFHGINTGGIIVICMICSFIWLVANTNFGSILAISISTIALIVSIIMGTRIYLNRMDMLGFSLICILLFGGVGLVINSLGKNSK